MEVTLFTRLRRHRDIQCLAEPFGRQRLREREIETRIRAALAVRGLAATGQRNAAQRVTSAAQKAGQAAIEGAIEVTEYAKQQAKEFASTSRGKKILGGAAIGGLRAGRFPAGSDHRREP